MSYVRLNDRVKDSDSSDKPRFLTADEIKDITDAIPAPPSADEFAAKVCKDGVAERVRKSLESVELCPSEIPELKKKIVERHVKSLISPGAPVGIVVAEAVGASATQMTLNTFHASGSSKSAAACIDSMKNLIFARATHESKPGQKKYVTCTIHFKNKQMKYEDVLDSRKYIVGSMVSDFVEDYDVVKYEDLEKFWWFQTGPNFPGKFGKDVDYVLRLRLDKTAMFKHRTTIKMIADVLMQSKNRKPFVNCLYGPISEGILYVFPNTKVVEQFVGIKAKPKYEKRGGIKPEEIISKELSQMVFLETIVQPELKNILVKGVRGIKELVPAVFQVWKGVLSERILSAAEMRKMGIKAGGTVWMLEHNRFIMGSMGLKSINLSNLCEKAGMETVKNSDDYTVVRMPSNIGLTTENGVNVIKSKKGFFKKVEGLSRWKSGYIRQPIGPGLVEKIKDGWLEKVQVTPPITEKLREDQVISEAGRFYKIIPQDEVVSVKNDGKVTTYVQITNSDVIIKNSAPSEHLSSKIAEDKAARDSKIQEKTKTVMIEAAKIKDREERKRYIQKPVDVARSELMRASELVYAEVDGANLRGILSIHDVDKRLTVCSSMHIMAATLGVEAARAQLIRDLRDTIFKSAGSYVHPVHIMFIAEFIMSRGEPHGLTYSGISRQPGGHLSLSTLERAGKVFSQGALHGRKEDIRNTSASVVVGHRIRLGNGFFDVGQDAVINGKESTSLNDNLFDLHERADETRDQARAMKYGAKASKLEIGDLMNVIDDIAGGADFQGFDFGAEGEENLLGAFPRREDPGHRETRPIGRDVLLDVKSGSPVIPPPAQELMKEVDFSVNSYDGMLYDFPTSIPQIKGNISSGLSKMLQQFLPVGVFEKALPGLSAQSVQGIQDKSPEKLEKSTSSEGDLSGEEVEQEDVNAFLAMLATK